MIYFGWKLSHRVKINYGYPWLAIVWVTENLRFYLEITYSRTCNMYNFLVTLLLEHICTLGSAAIRSGPHEEIKYLPFFFLGKCFLTKLLIDLCYSFNACISMHILHTVLYAFSKVLTRRLYLAINRSLNIWFGVGGGLLDVGHSKGLNGHCNGLR